MSTTFSDPATTPDAANDAAARRAKKREQDRKCQRRAREKTRSRITHLEEMVASLKQENVTKEIQDVWKQRDEIAAERDALAETLRVVERAIHGGRKVTPISLIGERIQVEHQAAISGGESQKSSSSHQEGDDGDFSRAFQPEHNYPDFNCEIQINLQTSNSGIAISDFSGSDTAWSAESSSHPQDPIIPHPKDSCDCSPAPPPSAPPIQEPFNLWRFANETLTEPAESSALVKMREDEFEDDTPVRAMIEGWDAVVERAGGTLPPSWEKLRQIDEILFGTCAKTERLAILRVMNKLFRYHQDRSPERLAVLPSWFIARPSQDIAHSYAIDYFAWPGLRERFIFHQHQYCSNKFWSQFCTDLRILWPFEFRDCYSRNVFTGEYKISPAFQERTDDIRAWTMAPDIFKIWPEFLADIPVFNPMSGSISPDLGLGVLTARKRWTQVISSATSSSHTSQVEEHDQQALVRQGNQQGIPLDLGVEENLLLMGDGFQGFHNFDDMMFLSTATE